MRIHHLRQNSNRLTYIYLNFSRKVSNHSATFLVGDFPPLFPSRNCERIDDKASPHATDHSGVCTSPARPPKYSSSKNPKRVGASNTCSAMSTIPRAIDPPPVRMTPLEICA